MRLQERSILGQCLRGRKKKRKMKETVVHGRLPDKARGQIIWELLSLSGNSTVLLTSWQSGFARDAFRNQEARGEGHTFTWTCLIDLSGLA